MTWNKIFTMSIFSLLQFRRQPFIAGMCVFIVLLFGGVTVKQNSLASGATSAYAATTVRNPPAKKETVRKGNWLQKKISKWANRTHIDGRIFALILPILSIALVLTGLILLIGGQYLIGIIFTAIGLAGMIWFYNVFGMSPFWLFFG